MAGRTRQSQSGKAAIDLYALASHDLRQVPQAIDLMIGGLQRARSADERARCMTGIAHAAEMLRQMERLLSLTSKWQRGIVRFAPERLLLGDIIQDLIDEIERGQPGNCQIDASNLELALIADRKVLEMLAEGIILLALKCKMQGPIEIKGSRADASVELVIAFEGRVPATALHEMAFVEHGLNEAGKMRLAAGPALARAIANMAGMALRLKRARGRVMVALSVPLI